MKDEIRGLAEQLTRWRRDFHQHPEIAFEETRTSGVLRDFLKSHGMAVKPYAQTGMVGFLEGRPGGRTVALRADMDALPLEEEGDKPYVSQNAGATHACGHDGHMAIVMGAAELLRKRRDDFTGRVAFLFQPAEEQPPGGAKPMIEEGALREVDAIFGLHLWQPLPTGKLGILKGPAMAQADVFTLAVRGRGGHGCMPHQTVDPILAASQIVVSMQSVVSRNVDPMRSAVVSFGRINGGTVQNIIPSEVVLHGTVRSFEPAVQALVKERVHVVAQQTAALFGASAEVAYCEGYPTLVNHGAMAELVAQVARDTWGEESLADFEPIMGGEDFAYYLQEVPGAFFFLGAGDGMPHPHHHPGFDLDERALPIGAELMAKVALAYLQQ